MSGRSRHGTPVSDKSDSAASEATLVPAGATACRVGSRGEDRTNPWPEAATVTAGRRAWQTRADHDGVVEGLDARCDELSATLSAGWPHERAAAELVAFPAEEAIPYVQAEEQTAYATAGPELAEVVARMVAGHRRLEEAVDMLASGLGADGAEDLAMWVARAFATQVAADDVQLGVLAAPHPSLPSILDGRHRRPPSVGGDTRRPDGTLDRLTALLVDGLDQLGKAGEGDRACRLGAAGWASLHRERPDLGLTLTAALHRLAHPTSQPGTPVARRTERDDEANLDGPTPLRAGVTCSGSPPSTYRSAPAPRASQESRPAVLPASTGGRGRAIRVGVPTGASADRALSPPAKRRT